MSESGVADVAACSGGGFCAKGTGWRPRGGGASLGARGAAIACLGWGGPPKKSSSCAVVVPVPPVDRGAAAAGNPRPPVTVQVTLAQI